MAFAQGVDPIDRELVLNSLRAVADEMAISLFRSAYTMVVREHLDFSTAVFDANGQLVVQGTCLALQLGALPFALRKILEAFPEGFGPDDVVLTNDPYLGGGTHLPDFVTVTPLYAEGRCLGYAAILAHKLDVGGSSAGGLATYLREIFQEGLRIPPVKIVDAGVEDAAVLDIIRHNVRVPHLVLGDVRGQLAALHVGRRGFKDCTETFGAALVERAMADILDYAEATGRQALANLPRRRAAFTDYLDDDGVGGEPIALPVAIEIKDDRIVIDYSSLPHQVGSAINATYCNTYSIALFAMRVILGSDVLVNDGLARLLEVKSSEASIGNAAFPAAVGSRGVVLYRLWDSLMGAISQLLPDQAMGAGDGGNDILVFSSESPRSFVLTELASSSWGGRRGADGVDGISHPIVNLSNTPVEHLEAEYPMLVDEYSVVIDSMGLGQHRGGTGIRRSYRVLADGVQLSLRRARYRFQPPGAQGGLPGALSSTVLVGTEGNRRDLPGSGRFDLARGDTVIHTVCGAGGCGNPELRDPELIRGDIEAGFINQPAQVPLARVTP